MDIIDIAQQRQAEEVQRAIKNRPAQVAGESLTHCEECGEEIPEKRRMALPGCRLCVQCKAATE